MIQFRIHGRGGQGGVTLAKMLAYMYWTEGKQVQAFGSYSAERTGAPILAFTLVDDKEITNRCQVYYPDNLIVVDPTLLGPGILSGLKEDAIILIDSPLAPEEFKEFAGKRVATIDAKTIARKYKLGTASTPITNTAIAGAFAKVFGVELSSVEKTIKSLGYPDTNIKAAKEAFGLVKLGETIPGKPKVMPVVMPSGPVPPMMTGNEGTEPKLNIQDWKSEEPLYSKTKIPPCNFSCPAGNNIQGFISDLMDGDYDRALETLRLSTPLPGCTSRVCPHPCEETCNREAMGDGKINIHALERLAADNGKVKPFKPEKELDKRVAVIGSGPAGLSAAFHLRKKGYKVVVFEALKEAGGLLRYGIPEFRLPAAKVAEEVKYIEDMGVEIKCNSAIKSKADFENLSSEFDAIIVAVGLSVGRDIKVKGASEDNVVQGLDFLKKTNFGEKVDLGSKVVVIGGGNTAIDASRVSLRTGAKNVSIVYRRSREEMPAIAEEIEAAVDEGIDLKFLHSPSEVIKKGGKSFLKVQKMKLGEPGDDGRRTPEPIEGEFEDIQFNTVILATGQVSELDFLGSEIETKWGLIKADGLGLTANSKVFASGDITTNEGTVTHAIGHGTRVAAAVDAYLSDKKPEDFTLDESAVVRAEELKLHYFETSERESTLELPVEERIKNFEEVNSGLIAATKEALRCLSCGVCNSCKTHEGERTKCELFCPERAIYQENGAKLAVDYASCKGCLICIEVCPRAAMEKQTVSKEGAEK